MVANHAIQWKVRNILTTYIVAIELGHHLNGSTCQNFGNSIFFLRRWSFVRSLCRYKTARPPGLQQVSHVCGVWKSVVLHTIIGSDTVKPQKTVTNHLMFGTLPYDPVWQAEMQLTPHHQIVLYAFKVCKSVHHHTFQIKQPTRCNNSSSLLLGVYIQLNMFRASSRPSSGAQQLH